MKRTFKRITCVGNNDVFDEKSQDLEFLKKSFYDRGNMEPCRWKFDRIMLGSISKQQERNVSYSFE